LSHTASEAGTLRTWLDTLGRAAWHLRERATVVQLDLRELE